MTIASTDLGRLSYAAAYAIQSHWLDRIVASRDSASPIRGHVLFVEHDPPVITVTPRKDAPGHVLASREQLAAAGVEVCQTDRGGDVTYHGPGQLVVYPIIDLNAFHLRLHDYMRLLEQVVIDTCDEFGVPTTRDPKATGVWTIGAPAAGDTPQPVPIPAAKIAALGVRVRRWVTMHGLALNVTTNLNHFGLIVPCGLIGRSVTSLERELGRQCPPMARVKASLLAQLELALARRASSCPERPSPRSPDR